MTLRRHREQPEEDSDLERFTMPATHVTPHPASRRLVLIFCAMVGAAIVTTGVGTLIAVNTSNSNATSIQNANDQRDQRNQQRDLERDHLIDRLNQQQQQLTKLSKELKGNQDRNTAAVCALAVGALEQNFKLGVKNDPLVITFAQSYGCTIPAEILPIPAPRPTSPTS